MSLGAPLIDSPRFDQTQQKSWIQAIKENPAAVIIVLGLLVAIGGGIWAGVEGNASLDPSRFQPLHLAVGGALVAVLGTALLAKARPADAKKIAAIAVGLLITTLLGTGATVAHAYDGNWAMGLTCAAGVAGLVTARLSYLRLKEAYEHRRHAEAFRKATESTEK